MRFRHRLAYYMVGFTMGLFFVAVVFSGKDTRCNYFPNARVLNDLRSKPFYYSAKASQILQSKLVDSLDIKNILTKGDVDFDKSNVPYKNGKLYIIEGNTSSNQEVILKMINRSDKVILDDIISK